MGEHLALPSQRAGVSDSLRLMVAQLLELTKRNITSFPQGS